MDPFTIALAVFGVSKLTGSSTKNSLRNALLAAGGTQLAGMGGVEGFEAFGQTGNVIGGADIAAKGLIPQLQATTAGSGISSLIGSSPMSKDAITAAGYTGDAAAAAAKGSGFLGLDPATKLAVGVGGTTLASSLMEDEEPIKRPLGMSDEDYAKAMAEARTQVKDIGRGASYTATTPTSAYNYGQGSLYTFNQGGIVSVMPKFSEGGINYLPSKITHNENDIHNYVRATGYVEDGSGNGDKDEDTILAQLADGEFVSRSDAVLGAGILSGANPESYKDMRRKGAAYFYDQQAKFKRIFDLIDASKQTN
jgi:hypothetical protein